MAAHNNDYNLYRISTRKALNKQRIQQSQQTLSRRVNLISRIAVLYCSKCPFFQQKINEIHKVQKPKEHDILERTQVGAK